jgi:hypothetical protein
VRELTSRGWTWITHNPCPGAAAGFYELSSDARSIELLLLEDGRTLASRESLPEEPTVCAAIPGPSFIEEI